MEGTTRKKEGAREKLNGQSPKQVEKRTNKNMKKITKPKPPNT